MIVADGDFSWEPSDYFECCEYMGGPKLRYLVVRSQSLRKCMERYYREHFDGLYISGAHGFTRRDLNFLKDYPDIQRLEIRHADSLQIGGLAYLKQLRHLWIEDNQQPLDLSWFPHLRSLVIDWDRNIAWPNRLETLEHLSISRYRPKSKDFTELPEFPSLKSLQVIQSPIHSLAGLERFGRLRYLNLAYCTKLERIGELSCESLRALELDVCRKISDHAHVATLPRLELLKMTHCGQMPSISFVKSMPRLKWFIFAYTHVLDGDMTPCLGLEVVSFDDKKHYSHTCEQIEAMIRERLGPRYPRRTWYEMVGEILSSP